MAGSTAASAESCPTDFTLTNAAQLATYVDRPGLGYPLAFPYEPGQWLPLGTWFADFSQLTNALVAVTNYPAQTQYGVPAWPVRIMQNAGTGLLIVRYQPTDSELLQLEPASSLAASEHYTDTLRLWCILNGMNPTNYATLLAEGYSILDPPRTVVDLWLADARTEPVWTNAATQTSASGHWPRSGNFEPDDEGDPCSITNPAAPFAVVSIAQGTNQFTTVTWQSCGDHIYAVYSANVLNSNTTWTPVAMMLGGNSQTSWTDTNTPGVAERFYKVQRLQNPLPGSTVLSAGGAHSLALGPSSNLWAWGYNAQEQLGDGTTGGQTKPEPIGTPVCGASISNVVSVSAGGDFSVASDVNGTVWTWGANQYGQLGNGAGSSSSMPSPIIGVSNVISVAAGGYHTLALVVDGTVWAWGLDDNGQLGDNRLSPSGQTNSPVLSLVATQIVAIAAGGYHSVALQQDGTVWTWGNNCCGQLGDDTNNQSFIPIQLTGISNVIAIAAGNIHTMALRADNTVWTWGDNSSLELGRNGNPEVPGQVAGLSNVVSIAAGNLFSLAVTSNGQMYAWGHNNLGQLGVGSGVGATNLPMLVPNISNVVLVCANPPADNDVGINTGHSLAMSVTQGVTNYWGWGDNTEGQVGNGGTSTTQYTPAPLHFCPSSCGCLQLGTSGTFTAPCTGSLRLWFNDSYYPDNLEAYTVTVVNVGSTIVLGTNSVGVVIGTVSNGVTYSYTATGFCAYGNGCIPTSSCEVDASGRNHEGLLVDCDGDHGSTNGLGVARTGFPCDNAICFSLVGQIQ